MGKKQAKSKKMVSYMQDCIIFCDQNPLLEKKVHHLILTIVHYAFSVSLPTPTKCMS